MDSETLKTVWEQQARWSKVANRIKAGIVKARSAALTLGILGAFLATLAAELSPRGSTKLPSSKLATPSTATNAAPVGASAQIGDYGSGLARLLSGVSMVALAAAAALATRFGPKQVQNWIRARSVSEALKQEVFLYMTGASPYGQNPSESPEVTLGHRTQDVLKRAEDLKIFAAGITVTPKEIPKIAKAEDYIEKRVMGQINGFYLPKAQMLSKRLKLFQGAATTLTTIAAVLSGTAIFQTERIGSWVAVATTIAAALAAHAAASRYQFDAISYYSTANQLKSLRDQFLDAQSRAAASPETYDRFVRQCEEVISIENQGWMANWQKLGDSPPPINP